jgi:hypothetical protein
LEEDKEEEREREREREKFIDNQIVEMRWTRGATARVAVVFLGFS